jgi:WD40 repeat protein
VAYTVLFCFLFLFYFAFGAVWGIKERSSVKVLQGHGAGVQSISFHPHQPHILLSGSWDNSVKVTDLPPLLPSSIGVSPLSFFLPPFGFPVVQLWDVNTNELLETFPFANTASGEQAWYTDDTTRHTRRTWHTRHTRNTRHDTR